MPEVASSHQARCLSPPVGGNGHSYYVSEVQMNLIEKSKCTQNVMRRKVSSSRSESWSAILVNDRWCVCNPGELTVLQTVWYTESVHAGFESWALEWRSLAVSFSLQWHVVLLLKPECPLVVRLGRPS